MQIHTNKIRNFLVFKIKTGYNVVIMSKRTMNVLGSTKQVIEKNKRVEM